MIIAITIIIVYTIALLIIFFYAISQINLLFNYIKHKKTIKLQTKPDLSVFKELPIVTIQLPVYNEMYVMHRLLANIAQIDYPKEKLEIQVLDDSTDETVFDTKKQIIALQKTGLDIKHITRTERSNFKAGALKEGLKVAKGEFIAIFDADFLPEKDWLNLTLPYFIDEQIGVVQTRWGHINKDYSLLTKIQAFALDLHFTLEQVGRNSQNHFINFNGTAGIWRKSCIIDAGNWQGDTLTEDLDLSYRAQLKNWKFHYVEDIVTPAELPVVISAARSQQFRWNKGGAENFQKMIKKIISSKNIPSKTKWHAAFHLLNSSMFFIIFIVAILSVPILYIKANFPEFKFMFYLMAFFLSSTIMFFFCYWIAFSQIYGGGIKKLFIFIPKFFIFFSIAMGFSWHNTIAILEGHFGKKSEFIRTPKFNVNSIADKWKNNKYIVKSLPFSLIIEGVLMLYFGFGLYSAFLVKQDGFDFGMFPFHLMLFTGFTYVFCNSIFSRS
ncbi:MAG: glycosyl transferase family 2 [Bacteroidetes bacterium HGW-Bacteroidetes-12]|nr:MAG: glycosyl transferase family 2 [Bacteroidetes bacterium HGW-Bacteroidetes-12]